MVRYGLRPTHHERILTYPFVPSSPSAVEGRIEGLVEGTRAMRGILGLVPLLLAMLVAAGCSETIVEPGLGEGQVPSPTFASSLAPTVPPLPVEAIVGDEPYQELPRQAVDEVVVNTATLDKPGESGCPDGLVRPAELIPVRIPTPVAELIPTEVPELLACLVPPARPRSPFEVEE